MTDNQLMLSVRDGDLDKMNLLFDRYSGLLLAFFANRPVIHTTCEDLVQEVFLRIMRYRHTYKPGKKFTAWLFTIARNVLRTAAGNRRYGKLHVNSTDLPHFQSVEPVDPAAPPSTQLSIKQEKSLLLSAIETLPEDRRQLIVMKHMQSLTYQEMSDILGVEPGTIRVRVHRALKELKRILEHNLKENSNEHELSQS